MKLNIANKLTLARIVLVPVSYTHLRDLASLGVRELCLVAQDTTRYGEDLYGTYALDALLRRCV